MRAGGHSFSRYSMVPKHYIANLGYSAKEIKQINSVFTKNRHQLAFFHFDCQPKSMLNPPS